MIGAHTRIRHRSGPPLAGMRGAVRAAAVDPTTPYGYASVLAVLTVFADRHLGRPTATATALLIAGALVGVCAVGAAALGTASVPRRLAVDTPAWQRLHVAAVGLSAVTGAVGVLTLPRGHEAWFMVGCASGVVFLVAAAVESTVGARLDAARTGLRPEPKRVLAPGADVAEWHARRQAAIASLLRLEPVQETSEVPDVPETPEPGPLMQRESELEPELPPEPDVLPDAVLEPKLAPGPELAAEPASNPAPVDHIDDPRVVVGRGMDHAAAVVVGTVAVVGVAVLVIRRRHRAR